MVLSGSVYQFLQNPKSVEPAETATRPFPVGSGCSVLRYLSVTIVTLYPVRHDRYMIVKVHSYVKVVLLIPSTVL